LISQSSQPPEPLEPRVNNLERSTADLRTAAELLLQTAQIHQRDLEALNQRQATFAQQQATLAQRQLESDRRFEILLAELRQLKIESDDRFNHLQLQIDGMQTEIRRMIDRLFNQQNDDQTPV
jgi:hypothetical protein